MKHLDDKPKLEFDEGWAIHFYDKHRRLRFAMEPSHGWMFLAGCVVGLLLGIVGYNLSATPQVQPPPAEPAHTAPLSID